MTLNGLHTKHRCVISNGIHTCTIALCSVKVNKMKPSFISHSSKETKDFAKDFAKQILCNPSQKKGALIIGLEGELGAGKTTFVQGFAKGLGIKAKVLSPTFLIMRKYQIPSTKSQTNPKSLNTKYQIPDTRYFYHIDCYRLAKPTELLKLGFKDIVSNPNNIVVIEWADRIRNILPKERISISFETTKISKAYARRITFF